MAPSGELKRTAGIVIADFGGSRALAARLRRIAVAHGYAPCIVGREVEQIAAAASGGESCVVLACSRPDRRVLEWLDSVRERLDGPAVVLVCYGVTDYELRRVLEAGAAGVVLLDRVDRALSAAIGAVGAGQVCVPAERGDGVFRQVLTSREKQILGLVVMGLTNGEIAGRLFVAESTVKSHLSSSFAKLGVGSRHEAASLILDPERGSGLGILTIPAERIPSPS